VIPLTLPNNPESQDRDCRALVLERSILRWSTMSAVVGKAGLGLIYIAGTWDGSLGKVTVERQLCGLCGLFGSWVRDGKEVVRESFPRPEVEGTIGVRAARAGTRRNVNVFRVRVEAGDELVLEDAVGGEGKRRACTP
jgi:hypothetical protein